MSDAPALASAPFTAALIQMRSTRKVDENVAEASRMIREAAKAGATYIQTPEMTNIMEAKREALFAAIAPEESDVALSAFRALARDLKVYLHIGSIAVQASPERAAEPRLPDRSRGRDRRALRQDPHVRCRSRQWRDLSRIHELSARRERGHRRPAVRPARADDLLRSALPARCSARWPNPAPHISPCRQLSRSRPARRTGIRCCARAPSRTPALCSQPRKAASMRTAARPMVIR